MLAVKLRAQEIPHGGGPQEAREGAGAGALLSPARKSHIINLRLVLRLTDLHPDPVDWGFRTVHE